MNELSPLSLTLYPNPTTDWVTVKLEGNSELTLVKLFDATGKKIEVPNEQRGAEWSFDLQSLPQGTYFLKVETQGEALLEPVVKQ